MRAGLRGLGPDGAAVATAGCASAACSSSAAAPPYVTATAQSRSRVSRTLSSFQTFPRSHFFNQALIVVQQNLSITSELRPIKGKLNLRLLLVFLTS